MCNIAFPMGQLKHTYVCVICGKEKRSNQSGVKYCSHACKMKGYRKGVTGDVTELRNAVTSLKSERDVTKDKLSDVTSKFETVTEKLKENAETVKKNKYYLSTSGLFCSLCGFYRNLCVCTDSAMKYQEKIHKMWESEEYKKWEAEGNGR